MVLRPLFTIDNSQLGKGQVLFKWNKDGTWLATVGSSRRLALFDRKGQMQHQTMLSGPGSVIALEWDCTGEVVAALQVNNPTITIWNSATRKTEQLDTNLKDLSFMKWSIVGPQLAVGTAKGVLLLFNRKTMKKNTVMGKHRGRIVTGAWSSQNQLILGGEDAVVTFSDSEGSDLMQLTLKGTPQQLSISTFRNEMTGQEESIVAFVLERKTLQLRKLSETSKQPLIELSFEAKYGSIVSYTWFGEGYLLMGFSGGYISLISTKGKEIGREVHCSRIHSEMTGDVTFNPSIQRGATVGDNVIKVFELCDPAAGISDANTERHILESEFGNLSKLSWTEDGQILTVGSNLGSVFAFLTKLPSLSDAKGTKVTHLISLRELIVKDILSDTPIARVLIETEPSFVRMGSGTLCLGMNNHIWYYRFDSNSNLGNVQSPVSLDRQKKSSENKHIQDATLVSTRLFPSTIEDVQLNAKYAGVLIGTQAILHLIDSGMEGAGESVPPNSDFRTSKETRKFPERENIQITCIAMTNTVFIMGSKGLIQVLSLDDFSYITEFKIGSGISVRRLCPNNTGTKIAYLDDSGHGHLFSPATDKQLTIEHLRSGTERFLWDVASPHIFVGVSKTELATYVYIPYTELGPMCGLVGATTQSKGTSGGNENKLGVTKRPPNYSPIIVHRGTLTSLVTTGSFAYTALSSHAFLTSGADTPVSRNISSQSLSVVVEDDLGGSSSQAVHSLLALNMVTQACHAARTREDCALVADYALRTLEIDTALLLYQQLGDIPKVLALEYIQNTTERYMLLGYVAMIQKKFDDAQTNFLRSANPKLALEMRRNLLHWDHALSLAERLAPQDVSILSRECAQQLEFQGDYTAALDMYRRGVVDLTGFPNRSITATDSPSSGTIPEQVHNEQASGNDACYAGIARMMLRTGNLRGGIQAVMQQTHRGKVRLAIDCAQILESMKQWEEAITLYEHVGEYDRAARIHIRETKNLKAAQRLIANVQTKNVLIMYAKAREAQGGVGAFEEAEKAYAKAEDWDSVVRVKVEHRNDLQGAHDIVRATRSSEAAALVARSCVRMSEYKAAIEFLLMAHKSKEALELARAHNEMETLGETLCALASKQGNRTDSTLESHSRKHSVASSPHNEREEFSLDSIYLELAAWFESMHKLEKAADFFRLAKHYAPALTKYLSVGGADCIEKAIQVVAEAKLESLTHRLFSYLMGETDGNPKDLTYIYRLYLSLGAFDKAARTSIILSRKEQEAGNYRVAHRMLFETFRTLRENNIQVVGELRRSLMLLHSYLIVRHLIQLEDHVTAVRMLLRVARNIKKFPKHIVPILSTTVMECVKADFRASAYEYATVLVQPEYRGSISEKYKKKIENLVRKKGKEMLVDPPEPTAPCPYCEATIPETSLECHQCKNTIPFCIASGKHLTVEGWSYCPNCHFPALHGAFVRILETNASSRLDDSSQSNEKKPCCPMCDNFLLPNQILLHSVSDGKIQPFVDDEKEVSVVAPIRSTPSGKSTHATSDNASLE